MARAKRTDPVEETGQDENLDQGHETDTLSGAIPEGELELARSLAKRVGWRPKEEWTRDPTKWRDAPEFLEGTVAQAENLQARHQELEERSQRIAQAAAAALEEERRRAREEATKVIREADDPAVREAAAQRLAENAGPPPETQAWLAKNPWFHTDPDAQALVVSTVNRMSQQGASISAQLEEAEKKVRQRFPEYFSAGTEQRLSDVRRAAPNAPQVQQGSRANGSAAPKEKGWAEVPHDDKRAFELHLLKPFMSRGLTREQAQAKYAEGYWKEGVLPPNEREEDPWVREKRTNPWTRR